MLCYHLLLHYLAVPVQNAIYSRLSKPLLSNLLDTTVPQEMLLLAEFLYSEQLYCGLKL